MKIPKQLAKRFENPDIKVRTVNGSYKVAEATVKYGNGKSYRVVVSRAHSLMESQLPNPEQSFRYPESSNSWRILEVPEELHHVAEKLYDLAKTSDSEAVDMHKRYSEAVLDFQRNFFPSY